MGSGATLVEGVRRWFQRRSSSTSTSTTINTNPNNNSKQPSNSNYSRNNFVNDHNDAHVSVSDLSAQSSTSHQREQKQGQEYQLQFEVEDDFDISGLKLISVPKRANFRAPPMDSQKKVLFQDLGFFCFIVPSSLFRFHYMGIDLICFSLLLCLIPALLFLVECGLFS